MFGLPLRSVGDSTGGLRRGLRMLPPGYSSGIERQNDSPSVPSATPCFTLSGVTRLSRPSWSSGPKSPQVEPAGLIFQRGLGTQSSLVADDELAAARGLEFARGASGGQFELHDGRV